MSDDQKYKQLEEELKLYIPTLFETMEKIIDQDVSDYPIFVAHQHEVEIGLPMINKDETSGKWSINVSTLEEFVTKQIIQTDKVQAFKKVYKDPESYLCMFVLSELGAQFIFLSR